MGIRLQLKGLARTEIDRATCPKCRWSTEEDFSCIQDKLTTITFEGIVPVFKCPKCGTLFVAKQKVEILDRQALIKAVTRDCYLHNKPVHYSIKEAVAEVEAMQRRETLH